MLPADIGMDEEGGDIELPPLGVLDIDICPLELGMEDMTDVDAALDLLEDGTAEHTP